MAAVIEHGTASASSRAARARPRRQGRVTCRTMKLRSFDLRLDNVSGEAIGIAAWGALLASAWVMYSSKLMYLGAKGVDITALDDSEKCKLARAAFEYVADLLPTTSPYRREIERYSVEALPSAIADIPMPIVN